jgi:hypothetical protein
MGIGYKELFSLQNGDEIIQGTPDLLNHATAFYKNLFGPQLSCYTRLRDKVWDENEKLSDIDRADMDRDFTEEESKSVIDQMEKNKAAGPDGFPAEFYQSCWEIVKDDLMILFKDFYQHKIDLAGINYGMIILIPKIDEAATI